MNRNTKELRDLTIKILDSWEIKSIDREARTFWAVASTEEKDRDDDIVSAKGADVKNFKKNPVILWAHDYRELPVAKALKIEKGEGKIRFQPQFAEHQKAKDVFDLYADGFLKAFSIGFIPKETEDMEDGGKFFKKWELLEISAVPVPSNPGALAEMRSKGLEPTEKPGFEETENEIRFRVREPGQFQEDSFKQITLKKDKPRVFAIIGKLEGETTTTTQALRFPKEDDWTIPKARTWVKAHPDAVKFINMASDLLERLDIVDNRQDEIFTQLSMVDDVLSRLIALENNQKATEPTEPAEGVDADPEVAEAELLQVIKELTPGDVYKISKKFLDQELILAQGGIIDKEDKL